MYNPLLISALRRRMEVGVLLGMTKVKFNSKDTGLINGLDSRAKV